MKKCRKGAPCEAPREAYNAAACGWAWVLGCPPLVPPHPWERRAWGCVCEKSKESSWEMVEIKIQRIKRIKMGNGRNQNSKNQNIQNGIWSKSKFKESKYSRWDLAKFKIQRIKIFKMGFGQIQNSKNQNIQDGIWENSKFKESKYSNIQIIKKSKKSKIKIQKGLSRGVKPKGVGLSRRR